MTDGAPKPETLRLFRKKVPPVALALGILGVLLAIGFMVYKIWSAMQPPDLQYRYEEPVEEKRR